MDIQKLLPLKPVQKRKRRKRRRARQRKVKIKKER